MGLRPYKNITPQVDSSAFVDTDAVVIGDVAIGADSSAWPMSVIRGDLMPIRIGRRTNVQDGAILHVTADSRFTPGDAPADADSRFAPGGISLNIGDNVTIAHGAIVHSCTLEDSILIGMHATILDGATVSTHTIIGANSLVPIGQQLEGGFLWVGSPVKKVRPLQPKEFELIEHLASLYVELKNNYT